MDPLAVLMPELVPNVLIVMVCNLLLLSIPDRNELAEQEKKFGTNHVYSVDPFNELLPPNRLN